MLEEGYYVSKINLNVVKSLDIDISKDNHTDKVERVYGSWSTKEGNIISFAPNKKVYLNKQDVALPNVRQLIESGVLTRTF